MMKNKRNKRGREVQIILVCDYFPLDIKEMGIFFLQNKTSENFIKIIIKEK